jgi:tRNA threonylcarbamoyl adenosine modification protein (Sua5/YciO/YrdC/YwlC family)
MIITSLKNIIDTNKKIYIHATDTCYGFACRYNDTESIETISNAKQRDPHKAFSLLFADIQMLEKYCVLNDQQKDFIQSQTSPSSFVLYKKNILKSYFPDYKTVAIRLENKNFPIKMSSILQTPVTTTSVNISTEPALYESQGILDTFKAVLNDQSLFIDSGNIKKIPHSCIWDLTKNSYSLIRK